MIYRTLHSSPVFAFEEQQGGAPGVVGLYAPNVSVVGNLVRNLHCHHEKPESRLITGQSANLIA
jgi:hypothetical protein